MTIKGRVRSHAVTSRAYPVAYVEVSIEGDDQLYMNFEVPAQAASKFPVGDFVEVIIHPFSTEFNTEGGAR